MAHTFACKCDERKKPAKDRNWTIWQYRCNHSAFNGYHWTPSEYSTVGCNSCGRVGRTKGKFVAELAAAVVLAVFGMGLVGAYEDNKKATGRSDGNYLVGAFLVHLIALALAFCAGSP